MSPDAAGAAAAAFARTALVAGEAAVAAGKAVAVAGGAGSSTASPYRQARVTQRVRQACQWRQAWRARSRSDLQSAAARQLPMVCSWRGGLVEGVRSGWVDEDGGQGEAETGSCEQSWGLRRLGQGSPRPAQSRCKDFLETSFNAVRKLKMSRCARCSRTAPILAGRVFYQLAY